MGSAPESIINILNVTFPATKVIAQEAKCSLFEFLTVFVKMPNFPA